MGTSTASNVTCWTLIHGAAAGIGKDRAQFSLRYLPLLGSFFKARWKHSPLRDQVDDAVQEVFLECFRAKGALSRTDPERPGGFRAFLFGVVRNVALRVEHRRGSRRDEVPAREWDPDLVPADDTHLSVLFDRAWAESLIREAACLQTERAQRGPDGAQRRVELLRLRFQEGLPLREIARRWGVSPDVVHRAYRKARQEFREALGEVIAFHHPEADRAEREYMELLSLIE